MPRPWSVSEREQKRNQLIELYVKGNRSISEVADVLNVNYRTVFDRLRAFGIKTCPEKKYGFLNRRRDIVIPRANSTSLAEFVGIMLGDGHVSPSQVIVTLHKDERQYHAHIRRLMRQLFGVVPRTFHPKATSTRRNAADIYLNSTAVSSYFKQMGLKANKVKSQVRIPSWISTTREFKTSFLRGLFDTDGSVYQLKFGAQACYKNASRPVLTGARQFLSSLRLRPSRISNRAIFITRRESLRRFFQVIQPKNKKHIDRAKSFGKIE